MTESRRILGPFNRVEGDLEVTVEVADGRVSQAWVNSPLFRGYEQLLQGRDPRDSLVYTPRICGICSVSQSVAAANAIAAAQGISPCPNGRLATNLILAAENLADHLTHFYLFFMPDFARDYYARQPWFGAISKRFKAQSGDAAREVLPARAAFLHITGLLAGKWPHSLAIQPGGTTQALESQEKIRLRNIILGFRVFLEQTLFGTTLEAVDELKSEADLLSLTEQYPEADFSRFLRVAADLDLHRLGNASDHFLSYGAYAGEDGHLFKRGTWHEVAANLDPSVITEDLSYSWLTSHLEPRHPYQGSTITPLDFDEGDQGYSWCKAPRLDGRVYEVGALSRQVVDGHPLIQALVSANGGNVRSRVIARLLELARMVPVMESWADQLSADDPYCMQAEIPDEAEGAGMVEAARGSLGHWLQIKRGKIINYQIIAPTTWNFSPRDHQGNPGALELALQGTAINGDLNTSVAIQHVIRSFDPCMVCTVH